MKGTTKGCGMATEHDLSRLRAALAQDPKANPPVPRLTVAQRDELRSLLGAGRVEDALIELGYHSRVAAGRSVERVLAKARAADANAQQGAVLVQVRELLHAQRRSAGQPASGAPGKAEVAPVEVAPPADAGPKRHRLQGRDDVLSGPIRKAVEAVVREGGAVTTADVWAVLQEVAIQELPPFLGVTPSDAEERGLRYTGPNGQTKVFTRDALRKRLNPGARGRSR